MRMEAKCTSGLAKFLSEETYAFDLKTREQSMAASLNEDTKY